MFRCLVVGALGGWVFAFRGGLNVLRKVRSVSRFVPGLLQEIAPRIFYGSAFVADCSLHEAKEIIAEVALRSLEHVPDPAYKSSHLKDCTHFHFSLT